MKFAEGKPVSAAAYALSDALRDVVPNVGFSAIKSEEISTVNLTADNLTVRILCNEFFQKLYETYPTEENLTVSSTLANVGYVQQEVKKRDVRFLSSFETWA